MKIQEVIGEVDKLMPNEIGEITKIRWLRVLDRQIVDEIVNTHVKPDGYQEPKFEEYGMETELVVDDIHAELYLSYLKMKIALEHVETERYAMEQTNYNNMYVTYRDYYNRNHRPLMKGVPRYR